MTDNHPRESNPTVETENDDFIDPRKYLDLLILWWREIVLCTVIGAISAGGSAYLLQSLTSPTYQAAATAIIARSTSSVTLDERFQTDSDESAAVSAARRASLVGLVKNGAIADQVVMTLALNGETGDLTATALLDRVVAEAVPSTDSRTPSDLIRITATAGSPELASAIANEWLRFYVEEVNQLYGQVPVEVFDAVVAEQIQSEDDFAAAQQNLEAFIAQSRATALNRQIAEQQALLDAVNRSQINAQVSALDQDADRRIALFESLAAAQTEPILALVDEQTRQRVQEISDLLTLRNQAARQLTQAQALLSQIEAGGDAAAASNLIALQMLKAQIFAETNPAQATGRETDEATSTVDSLTLVPAAPIQWSVNSGGASPTAAEQSQDVTALVNSLESYIAQLEEQIEIAGTQAGTGDSYRFLDQVTSANLSMPALQPPATESTAEEAAVDPLDAAIQTTFGELTRPGDIVGQTVIGSLSADAAESAAYTRQLEENIQALTAELEAERASERQLAQKRDLAWSAYETLSNKVVELNLERTAANREVRMGTLATPPDQPLDDISVLRAAMAGAILGLLFGLILALLMSYMGKKPLFSHAPAA